MKRIFAAALAIASSAVISAPQQAPNGSHIISPAIAFELPQQAPKRDLGLIDKWRFDLCQRDAAKAPTPQGVNIGMRLCREKFGQ